MEGKKKYTKDNINGIKFKCPRIGDLEIGSHIFTVDVLNDKEVNVKWFRSGHPTEVGYSMKITLEYLNSGTWTEIE